MYARIAKRGDAADIARISEECFGYTANEERTLEHIMCAAKDSKQQLLVMREGDEIIGFLHAQIVRPIYGVQTMYVHALAVTEQYRRMGCGRALLARAEAWGRRKGAVNVTLHSGLERRNAHVFYREHGYSVRKLQLNYVKPLGEEV